jgi:hypothetical protein
VKIVLSIKSAILILQLRTVCSHNWHFNFLFGVGFGAF